MLWNFVSLWYTTLVIAGLLWWVRIPLQQLEKGENKQKTLTHVYWHRNPFEKGACQVRFHASNTYLKLINIKCKFQKYLNGNLWIWTRDLAIMKTNRKISLTPLIKQNTLDNGHIASVIL